MKRAADLASTKEAREAGLRLEHGAVARARADEILKQFKLMMDRRDDWFSSSFPTTTRFYGNQLLDGWEFVDADTNISDFGTTKWKTRSLVAAFVNLNLAMKNQLLGEHKDFCFNLGVIFDDELSLVRNRANNPVIQHPKRRLSGSVDGHLPANGMFRTEKFGDKKTD